VVTKKLHTIRIISAFQECRLRINLLTLQKIGGTSAISNKFDCIRFAQSLQKIGGIRQIENKFSLRSFAQSLQHHYNLLKYIN